MKKKRGAEQINIKEEYIKSMNDLIKKQDLKLDKNKYQTADNYIFSSLKTYAYKYPYFTYPLDNDTNINPHQVQFHNNTKFLATVPWLELYSN